MQHGTMPTDTPRNQADSQSGLTPDIHGMNDMLDGDDDAGPAIDVRAIWAAIYRNRFPMLAIMVAAMLVGVASVLFSPKVYEARSSVQIDQQIAKVLGTEDNEPVMGGSDADRFLQTQVDILNSRAMARRVSDALGLAANDAFLTSMGIQPSADVNAGLRLNLVLDVLQKNLSVDMRRNSRVVGILFRSRDPDLAARVANSYATNFIEGNIQRRYSTTAYSRKFLQNQLGLAQGRLENSEKSLIGYARSARLIDASAGARGLNGSEGPRSLVTANLVQLNDSFATAEANRLQAQERWEQARNTPLMSLPEVLSNDAVQRLLQRRVELMAELNQLRQRLKPDHPTVMQASAQLNELDQQSRILAESIRSSIRNQYMTAQRQRDAIGAQVSSLKTSTLAEQDRSVQYNILKREVDTNRQLYESLLQRFKELSAEAGVTTNNITVVDNAELPRRPKTPRPLVNMALAMVIGMVLAALYALARERFDDLIRNPRDIEQRLHIPLLGVVPDQFDGLPLVGLRDPKSEISEAYHSIRTAIELSSNRGLLQSLVVTSSSKGEGKSTTSFALARDFAQLGKRVLLVDADLRRPSLHRLFELSQPAIGLSTVLARLTPIADTILPTKENNLSFLPAGPLPPDPANLFAGNAIEHMIASVTADYDLIVLDGPPVLALADATELSSAAMATIFVVEVGSAHFGQVRNAIGRLIRARGNLIGSVVTKYNSKKSGYGVSGDYYRYNYNDDANG